jgi:hypothetical protein
MEEHGAIAAPRKAKSYAIPRDSQRGETRLAGERKSILVALRQMHGGERLFGGLCII